MGAEYRMSDPALSDFVYCFSTLTHASGFEEGVIIPNGRIDLLFTKTNTDKLQVSLIGLETKPKLVTQNEYSDFFAVSFNPLAVEYIFRFPVTDIINTQKILPGSFLGIDLEDLEDFDTFCDTVSGTIKSLLPAGIDDRKLQLFQLIFAANGETGIRELSEKISWSERQINQYFNAQFGLSLKAYCRILRFQASLSDIRAGNFFPQLNYYDQSHFIKESKTFSGVSPKELYRNLNSRFLQFSATETK